MILDLCQDKFTGVIYYYLGLITTSKGINYVVETPDSNSVYPDIKYYLKLDFEMKYKLLDYKVKI